MVNFFEKDGYIAVKKEKEHARVLEIFSRKKSKCSSRYGTKKPVENINKQELLLAWREGDL